MPGRIDTERVRLTDEATAKRQGVPIDDVARRSASSIPMGRYGRVEEAGRGRGFHPERDKAKGYMKGSVVPRRRRHRADDIISAMINAPGELRRAIRNGQFKGLTTGLVSGYVQCNLAVVPASLATDFVAFCKANATACPVLAVGEPGNPGLPALGAHIDVRTDLPAYRVYRDGRYVDTPVDISWLWQPDHVAVAIGCWFSMEEALMREGVRLRHVELGIQGPLFRTNRATAAVGSVGGPLVVSMRPFAGKDVPIVKRITGRFPRVHGAPIHQGDPGRRSASPMSASRISANEWTFCRVRFRSIGDAG